MSLPLSCPSILQHYGLEIIAKELNVDQSHPDVEQVYVGVYKNFIEVDELAQTLFLRVIGHFPQAVDAPHRLVHKAVDAIDNGINQYDTDEPPRYINNTTLSSRVAALNPDWMDDVTPEKEDQAFRAAMELTGNEFLGVLLICCMLFHEAKLYLA